MSHVPTEEQEQRALAQWLDWNRVTWCHVPNGGQRSKAVAGKLKAAGVKAGVPDCVIFDRLECQGEVPVVVERDAGHVAYDGDGHVAYDGDTSCDTHSVFGMARCRGETRGIAVELKRRAGTGTAKGSLSPAQKEWIAALEARGWIVLVCYGADEAIASLKRMGIGR